VRSKCTPVRLSKSSFAFLRLGPRTAPRPNRLSLKPDEVYSLTAFPLYKNGMIQKDEFPAPLLLAVCLCSYGLRGAEPGPMAAPGSPFS
jgi:hypothetical protein